VNLLHSCQRLDAPPTQDFSGEGLDRALAILRTEAGGRQLTKLIRSELSYSRTGFRMTRSRRVPNWFATASKTISADSSNATG